MREKSLTLTHPTLVEEWHPIKNGDLQPDDVTAGSNKKVWWYLSYDDPKTGKHFDFEWQAFINARTKGIGCPFLSGKAVWKGYNDLATVLPQLAQEWHPIKNKELTPCDVTIGSGKKVWWYLSYDDSKTGKHFDFEWEAFIYDRANGKGCPFLSGKAVWSGYNDILTTHPDLAIEWHPKKNIGLTPRDITAGSDRKVWWYLPYDDPKTGKHFDFEWQASPSSRIKAKGCPFLAHNPQVWKGFNDLKTVNPELAKEWHPTKNGDLMPDDVTSCSNKKVWWYLSYYDQKTGKHFDFEWEASILKRNYNRGCPFTSQPVRAIWVGFNDLQTTHPELSKEWHPLKNKGITPETVSAGSDRKVWWLLSYDDSKTGKHFDFEWKATISHRVSGEECPYLTGKLIYIGFNDLESVKPELAKEWHPTKNGNLYPSMVTYRSAKKVWWLLPYDDPKTGKHFDFEWRATVDSRSAGIGCPFLPGAGKTFAWKGFNDLETTDPELAKEWHPTKNGNLKPDSVTRKSDKKVWWYLSYDDPRTGMHYEYEWTSTVGNRTAGNGCPYLQYSKGEIEIERVLNKYSVKYKSEYIFPQRKYKGVLRDDFAILADDDTCIATIEYNGEQHYKPVDFSGKGEKYSKIEYEKLKKRDEMKSAFLKKHAIPQLIIPYWEYDNIESLVKAFLKNNSLIG